MDAVKIKTLFKARQMVPFHRKINLWDLIDDMAVGVDLQMSAGLELADLPDIVLKGESEAEVHLSGIKKLLHSLPEETTFQLVIQSRQGDAEKIDDYLRLNREGQTSGFSLTESVLRNKEDFLKKKFTQKRRWFLFITTYPQGVEAVPRMLLSTFADIDRGGWTAEIHDQRKRQLNAVTENVIDSLRNLRVHSRRMNDQELAVYFFKHLNPRSAPALSVPEFGKGKPSLQQITARSVLARSASQSRFDSFLIDGLHHKAVNLLLLPEFLAFSQMDALACELWPDYDLALTIHTVNSERLISKLKASGNVAKALSFSNFGGHYEATQKFAELDEMIREIRATTQKLFTFSLCVLFKGKDPQEVEDQAQSGLKAFQELGAAGGLIDNLLHEDLFLSFLPNHSHLNPRQHVMNTDPLTQIVPLQAPWYGTQLPKMLFENPQGELVSLDVFDPSLPAKHAVLVGTTGSGKSFTCNYLLTHFFIESPLNHVIIIDIGGSYRKLSQLFGGQYLNVELSDQFAFNPLPPKSSLFDGKDYDPDEIAYLTLILQRMVLDENEALNSLGETILEKAVKRTYHTLPANQAPLLRDVRQALGETTGDEETVMLAQHYFKNLEMWADGRYSKIFNSAKRLEIDNRMIVFDLERLGHHPRLQSVYFYVIREIIDAKLRDKSLRKMIVIDEGWRFFNDEIGSRLIENLYRTARKSNGMVLSISQSPVDFLSTKAANAIISNSYVKYILRLTKGHDLLPQFGFTATEIEAIKNLSSVPRKYSDLYLKFNEHGTVIRVEPSPLDYWICTTDPEDAMKESALRSEHPDWSHAQVLQTLAQGGTQ